ncbi:MAG: prepilin-type N-terminal cleavage/methylation domain-containing protein [Xanthomonadales bacterium]|nr:prepilin-type N-terminal cleavage/methylation domain-containing protein [Xanthomonadales bacterium]
MKRLGKSGFSLLELMITIAIVGILLAIALPAYNDQIRRARRAEGRNKLQEISLAQQRFYTNCNRYAMLLGGQQVDCSGLGIDQPVLSEHGHYQLALQLIPDGWILQAVPTGDQMLDVPCGTLSLSHTGAKSASGSDPAHCW